MKQKFIVWLIVLLSPISVPRLHAASAASNRSLKGLAAVRVVVEDLNRDAQAAGLRKDQLYALAAQQLNKDGLTVIGPQDPAKAPIIYVRLSSAIGGANQDAPVSFYLNVQVKQLATFTRGSSGTCQTTGEPATPSFLATTWEKGSMAIVEHSQLLFYTRQILINLLGELTTDQKEANGLAQAEL
jgi:hypothetical protein